MIIDISEPSETDALYVGGENLTIFSEVMSSINAISFFPDRSFQMNGNKRESAWILVIRKNGSLKKIHGIKRGGMLVFIFSARFKQPPDLREKKDQTNPLANPCEK